MLTELCAELRNYFEVPNGRHFGTFTISGGSIAPLDFLYTTPKGAVKMMSQLLNSAVFPGQQGGPLEHVIAEIGRASCRERV